VPRSDTSQFRELAEYYDPLNEGKDYRGEAERLEVLARRFGRAGRTTWLDVACGTGRHLEVLSRKRPCVGLDASSEMLRIARRRLPRLRLVRGDMRTFRLGRRFDVVSCLFSAIGHLRTKEDVRKTFANFARHLNPGGVAIVEPWIAPADFRDGMIRLQTFVGPTMTIARCASGSRRGNRSRIHYHFLVGKRGREIRYYEVTDVGLLLSRPELLRLMRAAGLHPRFLRRGLTSGRGLLVGVKAGVR
jgi:ubiquinone/menaquinone biosynthesis C-methylase UbiE